MKYDSTTQYIITELQSEGEQTTYEIALRLLRKELGNTFTSKKKDSVLHKVRNRMTELHREQIIIRCNPIPNSKESGMPKIPYKLASDWKKKLKEWQDRQKKEAI